MRETHIYIRIGAGSDAAWQPVMAREVGDHLWLILPDADGRDTSEWEFRPGETVRCLPYELTDHDLVLKAVAKASGAA